MTRQSRNLLGACLLFSVALLVAEPAAAFRCGTRLVVDGMHEAQVIAACGEPTTRRHLGFAIRSFSFDSHYYGPGWRRSHFPGYGTLSEQVAITEFVYNFGPRKFMRRLLFEGGVLVRIETIGRRMRSTIASGMAVKSAT